LEISFEEDDQPFFVRSVKNARIDANEERVEVADIII
jgi:hypothetical protein